MPDIVGTLKLPRLATAPSSPVVGQMYYNTTVNQTLWWNGTLWIPAQGLPADTVAIVSAFLIRNKLLAADAQPAFQLNGDGMIQWGPGGSTVLDTSLQRVSAGYLYTPGSLQVQTLVVVGEVYDNTGKWFIDSDGAHQWGPGDWSRDTSLARTAPNVLTLNGTLHTNAIFVDNGGWLQASGVWIEAPDPNNIQVGIHSAGEARDRFHLYGSGKLEWGDGTNLVDTVLYRSAAGKLRTDGTLDANALTVNGVPVGGGGAGVDYIGNWGAGTSYKKGDVVRYNNSDYLAVNDSVGQTPVPSGQSVILGELITSALQNTMIIDSIPQQYETLVLEAVIFPAVTTNFDITNVTFNRRPALTPNEWMWMGNGQNGAFGSGQGAALNQAQLNVGSYAYHSIKNGRACYNLRMTIPGYSRAIQHHFAYDFIGEGAFAGNGNDINSISGNARYPNGSGVLSAITGILLTGSRNFGVGSRVTLYGLGLK